MQHLLLTMHRIHTAYCLIVQSTHIIFLYFMMRSVSRLYSIKRYDDGWKIKWKEYGRKQSWPKWGTIPDAWRNWGNLLEMLSGLLAWQLVCDTNKSQIQFCSITTTPACSHCPHTASQYVASTKQSFKI